MPIYVKLQDVFDPILDACACTRPHIKSSLGGRCLHLTTLSTQVPSSLLTPSLKASTSFQQSNGLRSFPLKHLMTFSLAVSTAASTSLISLTFLRFSNFSRSFATSLETASRPSVRSASPAADSFVALLSEPCEASASRREASVASSRACRRFSSSATRV